MASLYKRAPKERIFVGCEGKSEMAYVALIRLFCENAGLRVHLVPIDLDAGDPLSRVEEALRRINDQQRNRENFAARFILLDDDQTVRHPQRALQAKDLAQKNDISLIWQSPCHEAMLLRHFETHTNDRPASSAIADRQLKTVWREYLKPMERRDLERKIGFDAVLRVAKVEQGLFAFLTRLGLITLDAE
jgi:RloB-like protein